MKCAAISCLKVAGAIIAVYAAVALSPAYGAPADQWSAAERAVLAGLQISQLPKARPDPSNAVERSGAAAALGKQLFFDARLSGNQKVSCASCHIPERQFQDSRALAQGVGAGLRRTMPIADVGGQSWFFWDGRKDSLWSQALGPLEDANEHGGNRVAYARLIERLYRTEYEAVFSPLPSVETWPENAGPNGTPAQRNAWQAMSAAQQQDVLRVFSNMGKAIAAYELTLRHEPSRLDQYIGGVLHDDPADPARFTPSEKRGLRLFIGKAQCVSCHNGPLLSDHYFHNTGVAPLDARRPEQGRASALAQLLKDTFNCLGPFSDTAPRNCRELRFLATDDDHMTGAFKTPGLRNVSLRAPYMHAGQIATLPEVIDHYARAPAAAIGKNERRPLALNEQERADLVNFLATLNSNIAEARTP
jgi:cytochrome c peroxidase